MTNKIREIDATQALHKTGLERQHVLAAIQGLRRANLLTSDPVHAAAAPQLRTLRAAGDENINNRTLVNQVIGQARSLGAKLDPDKMIDIDALNGAIRHAPVESRMALKTNLASLRVIP